MNSAHSLSASADLAETIGRGDLATFYRDMARDALALETHFPGSQLYVNWAKQAAEYIQSKREAGDANNVARQQS